LSDRTELLCRDLEAALVRLEDALSRPFDEFIRDSAIQRFEFTFELFWKTLKSFCEDEGLRVHSPREALRGGFQAGLLSEAEDEHVFRMLEDRNLTSHTYNVATAEEIFSRLAGHTASMRAALTALSERLR
jgi:nucleotidyltransferase substrate binding protein (TIGR01987 family)